MLFVGNFLHAPNIDAAMRLTQSIFPLVRRARPDAQLVIVGPEPPAALQSAGGDGVTITGPVDSVVPYLDAASVVVAPLAQGGGTRVKVLEALAAGKAVVASRRAAAGLDVVDGRHILLADDIGEFAAAIVRLLNDEKARIALARGAREWACAHGGWEPVVAACHHCSARCWHLAAGARRPRVRTSRSSVLEATRNPLNVTTHQTQRQIRTVAGSRRRIPR